MTEVIVCNDSAILVVVARLSKRADCSESYISSWQYHHVRLLASWRISMSFPSCLGRWPLGGRAVRVPTHTVSDTVQPSPRKPLHRKYATLAGPKL